MDKLYRLKENLEKELGSWSARSEYDMGALQVIKTVSSALDHLGNVIKGKKEEQGGEYGRRYGGDGYGRARDSRGRYMAGEDYSRMYGGDYGHDPKEEVAELKRKLSALETSMRM